MSEEIKHIGTCGHELDSDWYESDDSTYTVCDPDTGIYTLVTTCSECKVHNVNEGIIVDEHDIPMDFDNPFADDPAPDTMVVFDADGNSQTIKI